MRERLRRDLNDSAMLKYGLDSFVEGAIGAKKRSFAPQIRQIIAEYTGTTGDNDDDNNVNMSNGRDYTSWDRYHSHSYGRNDRYDRDYYSSNHSRRNDYDSNSVMEYDVDNTEQDMEVDDSNSSSSASTHSEDDKASNEDSSVQARLNSFLQTFKEFSKKQEQHKQQRQESAVNSSGSASSTDSQDVISKISSGEPVAKPLTRPLFKFNFTTIKSENGLLNPLDETSQSGHQKSSIQVETHFEESKDNFSPQDMNLDDVSPTSDHPSIGTPLLHSEVSEDVKPVTIKSENATNDSTVNEAISTTTTTNSTLPPLPVVTLPPAHLLSDTTPIVDEDVDDYDDDEISDSPKAPTPEPISPGSIDMNLDAVNSDTPGGQEDTTATTAQTGDTRDTEKVTTPEAVDTTETEKRSTSAQMSETEVQRVTTVSAQDTVTNSKACTSNSKEKIIMKKEPMVLNIPNVPDIPLEEILSDVSSVHTSDLSDFDDCISISSCEDLSLSTATGEGQEPLSLSVTLNSTAAPTAIPCGRRKISLQEVKQQLQAGERVTSASSSIASSSGSNSHATKGAKAKKVNSTPPVTSPAAQSTATAESKQNTSGKGRQRKINPKYASDEYFT